MLVCCLSLLAFNCVWLLRKSIQH